MGKRRGDDELESLRKENRELKSINRQLMKQVKKLNKGYHKIRDDEDEPEEKEEIQKERCLKCNSTNLNSSEFKLPNGKNKRIVICENCGLKKSNG